ncbi:PAS domain S-box protein [Desulforhopalus sp. IMCC35007]|uniref:PAS domain S-box protein n=1 Tax=Desulforhopalus sp. IMCC35007 TaxID=2569543 RepID=UPI0010AE7A58|nr:PAS domain S-box protein [Desulforhopalus sp. IMCC35007]TKB06100.1 PAS domain S-box protein [Desulforhopalus sp. IMCC35007]
MESTLQTNISELYYIFENTTDGIVFEQNGIVVRLNRAVEQLLGYKREEIIGLQSQQFKNMILEGSSDRFLDESNHTFYVKKKDGQHFWATIKTNSFLNEDDIPATIWKIEDVSRLRDAELKLRQMSLAVEQSSNSVVITDTDGIIQYVNSAFTKTTGYSAHEVIGKNPSVLQSGRTPSHLFKEMWESITRGMEWSGQFINKKKNGDFYEEHVAVAPIRDELGNITNFIASKENITELKKARKQAEKMSKAKGDFLAYVSHEIRTPLNVIAGMSDLVLETNLETEQQQFMKRIKSSADNLLLIVNDLLDHSKIEAGKLIIENHPFSLTDLVTDIQETLSFLAEKKGITLSVFSEQPSEFQLQGDRLRLYQILYNLVSNSLKFTEKGKVELSVNTKESAHGQLLVTFQVKDSGIGIHPDKLNTIFDSFVQAEAAITRNFGGTGLGLAISNELVKLMGGSLEVRSIPGLGSTFSFSILLTATSSDGLEPPDDQREENDLPSEKLHVLLVEDDKGNQELASAILKSAGHTVTVTNHGLEALQLLANGEFFHVVLMDVQMPVLDGLTTTQCIRRVEEGGGTGLQECEDLEQKLVTNLFGGHQHIIAMTANTMLGDKERCRESGVDNFLAKPYTKVDLLSVLNKSTKDSRQNKDLCVNDRLENSAENDTASVSYIRCRQYLLENFNLNDESSKHVLDTFIDSLQQDLEQLHQSILDGSRDNIRLFSHKMKGALHSINLDELANLAQELENDAHIQSLVEIGTITDQIGKALSPLMKKYEEIS